MKTKKIHIVWFYAILLTICSKDIFAQNITLQVVSKKIENTYSAIQRLNIQGEKADIELYAWTNPEIKVTTELIAKHPNRETAKNDLSVLKYEPRIIGNELYLGSYVLLNKNAEKPTSNLKTHYIIFLPTQVALEISNVFGKVVVKGKFMKFKLKSEFSQIEMTDIQGVSNISTKFGEIITERTDGEMQIETDHSDLTMKQLSGNCKIKANYGKIDIQPAKGLDKLDINANKTDVQLAYAKLCSIEAQNDYGKLNVPNNFTWKINNEQQKIATFSQPNKPKILVKNTFGNTSIEN